MILCSDFPVENETKRCVRKKLEGEREKQNGIDSLIDRLISLLHFYLFDKVKAQFRFVVALLVQMSESLF